MFVPILLAVLSPKTAFTLSTRKQRQEEKNILSNALLHYHDPNLNANIYLCLLLLQVPQIIYSPRNITRFRKLQTNSKNTPHKYPCSCIFLFRSKVQLSSALKCQSKGYNSSGTPLPHNIHSMFRNMYCPCHPSFQSIRNWLMYRLPHKYHCLK